MTKEENKITLKHRTKGEKEAYYDGFEMCAECIESYLKPDVRQYLSHLLVVVKKSLKIEDIEPQENEDAIEFSEKDAIKMLKSKMDGHTDTSYEWAETVRIAIKAIEQNTWIPVSERTPEDTGYYLTTTMYGEVYRDYWSGSSFDRSETVIAWMPKPKPYRPQESEDDKT